jgi:hypothetical protein
MLPPEQAAAAFLARLDASLGLSATTLYASDSLLRDAAAALVAAEREAVREACVDVADNMDHPEYNGGPGKVAAALRELPLD